MGLLKFELVGPVLSQTQSALTDSSSGTASTTIAAIGATYDQDEVRNAVASLAARLAEVKVDVADLVSRLNKAN